MLIKSKQLTCYLGKEQNKVGLSEITFCIHQIDLSPSQINSRIFFIKILIYSINFSFQDIL